MSGARPARPPGPGAEAEVEVTAIAAGGAGVGRLPEGRVVFVHRTAPGDRARIRIVEGKRSWARGELVELLEAGPGRTPPPCPYYERCGGCTLEHLAYPAQLRAKARIVSDALERVGGLPDAATLLEGVTPSPEELRYRSRVSFHLRRLGGGRVVAGFHALGRPGRIVDLDGRCLLPEAGVAAAWDALRAAWGPGAGRLPPGDRLRLTLRGVEEGVVLLVEGGRPGGDPAALLREVDGLRAVWHRSGPGDDPALLAGAESLHERWLGRRYRVGPTAFVQVNREAGEALHRAVLSEVGDARGLRVADLYCGVGAWGRALAEGGASVTAVELDPAAVRAARDGAPDDLRVLEGRVEDRVEEALPADLVVLNPPRDGVAEAVTGALLRTPPERIVYVSCDPATLARDLARLAPAFAPAAVRARDLFPQTAHVECVVRLERKGA